MRERVARRRRRARGAPPVDADERAEARDLLEWMHDGHFTFLGYREYDLLTEDGEDVLRAVSGLRARHPPRDRRAADLDQLRAAAAGRAAARARAEPAQPDEGQLAVDRPPARRTSTTSASSASTPPARCRRAALPRALHAHRLQREPVGDPGAPAQGASACSSGRASCAAATTTRRWSRSSRRTRATSCSRSPRTSSSRRRWASCTCERQRVRLFVRRTRSAASCPAWSTCRATATTREPRSGSRTSSCEAFGGTSVDYSTRVSESVLARLHFVVYTEPGASPGVRRRRDRGPPGRGDALLDGRSPRRALGAARRGARRRALRALRRGVPRRLPRGLPRPRRPCSTSSASSGSTRTTTSR